MRIAEGAYDVWLNGNVIVLSGKTGVGKSTVALELARHFEAIHLRTSDVILDLSPPTRKSRIELQAAGNALDQRTGFSWIARETEKIAHLNPKRLIVVDAARVPDQIVWLRRLFPSTTHAHLTAERQEILHRYQSRSRVSDEGVSYEAVESDLSETWAPDLRSMSDLTFRTDRLTPFDIAKAIIAFTKP